MKDGDSIAKLIKANEKLKYHNLIEITLKLIPIIAKFCELYNAEFEYLDISIENTIPGETLIFEPIFYFNDNLGYYTKKGLLDSVLGEEGETLKMLKQY